MVVCPMVVFQEGTLVPQQTRVKTLISKHRFPRVEYFQMRGNVFMGITLR